MEKIFNLLAGAGLFELDIILDAVAILISGIIVFYFLVSGK